MKLDKFWETKKPKKKKKKPKRKLTWRQEKFKNNLLEGMSQKDAFIKAGYKNRGQAAIVDACRLAKNPLIVAALKKSQRAATYRAEISTQRILEEEKCVAFSNVTDIFKKKEGVLVRPDQLPKATQRAIAGLEIIETNIKGVKTTRYKYKFWDKGRSLERLGKHVGLFEKDNAQQNRMMFEFKDEMDRDMAKEFAKQFVAGQLKKLKKGS